jgi:hypothetical protein
MEEHTGPHSASLGSPEFVFKRGPLRIVEESPEKYRTGGFHPVRVGDIYHGYKIVRKLGYGAHSTVWLADDQK